MKRFQIYKSSIVNYQFEVIPMYILKNRKYDDAYNVEFFNLHDLVEVFQGPTTDAELDLHWLWTNKSYNISELQMIGNFDFVGDFIEDNIEHFI